MTTPRTPPMIMGSPRTPNFSSMKVVLMFIRRIPGMRLRSHSKGTATGPM